MQVIYLVTEDVKFLYNPVLNEGKARNSITYPYLVLSVSAARHIDFSFK